MFVKKIPKTKTLFDATNLEQSYLTNNTTIRDDVHKDSNLIKAMEEAISEYLSSMDGNE